MIRIVSSILLIIGGSIATILTARELSIIISSYQFENSSLIRLLLYSLFAFCLPVGQYLFSSFITLKLEFIGESKAIQISNDYTRDNQNLDNEKIATLSTELGRAQGIFGNNLATVVSSLVLFTLSILYMGYKENLLFFYLILIFSVLISILFICQRSYLKRFGVSNRKYAGITSKLVNSFVKHIEFFLVSDFQFKYFSYYKKSLRKWLKSIVDIWFVAALSKYIIEFICILTFIIMLGYYELNLVIESYIILFKLLPGFQALLQFFNGIQTNKSFFGTILKQLTKANVQLPLKNASLKFLTEDLVIQNDFMVLIEGKSGSGKSTILKQYAHSRDDCLYLSEESLDPTIYNWVLNHLSEDCEANSYRSEIQSSLITSILDFDRSCNDLSHGQKQRCMIVSALMSNYETIIFDELLSGLDKSRLDSVIQLVKSFKGSKSIILVDHSGRIKDIKELEVIRCDIT